MDHSIDSLVHGRHKNCHDIVGDEYVKSVYGLSVLCGGICGKDVNRNLLCEGLWNSYEIDHMMSCHVNDHQGVDVEDVMECVDVECCIEVDELRDSMEHAHLFSEKSRVVDGVVNVVYTSTTTSSEERPSAHGGTKRSSFSLQHNSPQSPQRQHRHTNDEMSDSDYTTRRNGIRRRRVRHNSNRQLEHDTTDVNDNDPTSAFMTGNQKLALDEKKSGRRVSGLSRRANNNNNNGGGGNGVKRKFVSPMCSDDSSAPSFVKRALKGPSSGNNKGEEELPEELKGCDPKLVEMISNEMMDHSPQVKWTDICGLEFAKSSVQEVVVWPLVRPDVFTGIRRSPRGLLLFGPPGTGKTLIGKAIATESGAKFFSISASSLTSKWHGEGEKLVRTLFAVATYYQPSVIFIDEIDSLLSQRSDSEFEGSRRLKTEFLVQLDGAKTSSDTQVLLIGATNRPEELDEAARRRLVKRLYIPLPDSSSRRQLVQHVLTDVDHHLSKEELDEVVNRTDGYSGADMKALCTEAAFGPIRSVPDIKNIRPEDVRPIIFGDFENALLQIRPSVSEKELMVSVVTRGA